jgi:hypothetical protein
MSYFSAIHHVLREALFFHVLQRTKGRIEFSASLLMLLELSSWSLVSFRDVKGDRR